MVQIVALTGTFTDSSKHGVTTMGLGNIVDQFHDKYGLADTGATEKTNFTSLSIWSQEIDHLNTSDQNFLLHRHFLELWSFSMNSSSFVGIDGTPLVNWVTNDIDDTTKSLLSDRNTNGSSGIGDFLSTDKTFGTIHSNGPHGIFSQMLGDLEYQPRRTFCHVQGVKNFG